MTGDVGDVVSQRFIDPSDTIHQVAGWALWKFNTIPKTTQ